MHDNRDRNTLYPQLGLNHDNVGVDALVPVSKKRGRTEEKWIRKQRDFYNYYLRRQERQLSIEEILSSLYSIRSHL